MLHLGAHTGTHVDAPAHFIAGGSPAWEMPLDTLIGRVLLIDIPQHVSGIAESDIPFDRLNRIQRVLFKTRNSSFWPSQDNYFRTDFTYIEPAAARALVDAGVRLVGIDYLSVEKYDSGNHDTHLALLASGVVILEGLDLRNVEAGEYELICLPLKVVGGHGDGVPARAVLRTLE
jgi:arylformamidase